MTNMAVDIVFVIVVEQPPCSWPSSRRASTTQPLTATMVSGTGTRFALFSLVTAPVYQRFTSTGELVMCVISDSFGPGRKGFGEAGTSSCLGRWIAPCGLTRRTHLRLIIGCVFHSRF